jgi:hypothetical protein
MRNFFSKSLEVLNLVTKFMNKLFTKPTDQMKYIASVMFAGLFVLAANSSFACSDEPVLNRTNLEAEMNNAGIRFVDIAIAQAMLESDNFTSKVFKRNHNMFGMQLAEKRKTTAIGKKGKYALYKCWHGSVQDYALRQQQIFQRHPNMTRMQYLAHIKRFYAEDPHYMVKLQRRIKIVNRTIESRDFNPTLAVL